MVKITDLFDTIFNVKDTNDLNKIKNFSKTIFSSSILNLNKKICNQYCILFYYYNNIPSMILLKKNFDFLTKQWCLNKFKFIIKIHFNISRIIIRNNESMNIDEIFLIKYNSDNSDDNIYINNSEDCFDNNDSLFQNNWNVFNNDLLDFLKDYKSGFFISKYDISWEILLNYFIILNTGIDDKNLLELINYKKFEKNKLSEFYFGQMSINYNIKHLRDMTFYCDICSEIISDNFNKFVWSNVNYGQICDSCYKKKQIVYEKNKHNLIKSFLMTYRSILFQKKLKKTHEFLKNYSFKEFTILEKYNLQKKFNRNIKNYYLEEKICTICRQSIFSHEISSSKCGHCFHTRCINLIDSNNNIKRCPTCRQYNFFYKIYL
jgi:hypothetical protein